MNEINLELEKDSHKSVNISNSTPNTSGVNILRDTTSTKSSDIGLDLLINKSKAGGDGRKSPLEEFKPSEPISSKSSSPFGQTSSFSGISSNNNSSPFTEISLDKEIDLSDIGITDTPVNNITSVDLSIPKSSTSNKPTTPINITSTVDLGSSSNNNLSDLDLNLDNLLSDDKPNSIPNSLSNDIKLGSNDNSGNQSRSISPTPIKKSYEELQKEKAEFIRLLERMEKRGLNSHKKFTMDSDYNEVKGEFERLSRQRECDQSVKFQRKMLVAFITAIEFLNNKFDPIDLKLDGWSESIHENVNDYDDVFEELHEKYKGSSQMAPELKLLLMVGGSGFMFHLTNTMFKSSLPGMGDVMRQNPDLMKQFASAAANTMGSMGGESSGFGNLMGGVLGGMGGGSRDRAPSGPPPAPRRQMNGPPDISDILNNMSNNQNVNIDLNSGFSESEVETSTGPKKKRTINLDI